MLITFNPINIDILPIVRGTYTLHLSISVIFLLFGYYDGLNLPSIIYWVNKIDKIHEIDVEEYFIESEKCFAKIAPKK